MQDTHIRGISYLKGHAIRAAGIVAQEDAVHRILHLNSANATQSAETILKGYEGAGPPYCLIGSKLHPDS